MIKPHGVTPATQRWTILVRGVIQGVGFRPFVYNAARARGLTGWVQNEAGTVSIEVQGAATSLEDFLGVLRHGHPPQAKIDSIEVNRSAGGQPEQDFVIRSSPAEGTPRPTIPADLATCAACLEEVFTPGERRYEYPFTNCTNCGPRWSIIEKLPYDRPRTSMAQFVMCPDCEAEYRNPADRRFHAQPIACPRCGPRLELLDGRGARKSLGPNAFHEAVRSVLSGAILALKGLGGFHLVVDATDSEAVDRLRKRKHRPDKPFAVMLATLVDVRARCEVDEEEARTLASSESPILLLRRRHDGQALADIAHGVAPGNPRLGVMLPYTPLHHLLLGGIGRPIVCTSGNLSEEPMAIATEDALKRLGSIADVLLVHDRPIVRPVDDSVGHVTSDGLQLMRRARGYAPRAIDLGRAGPTVLAVGGHLKNTVALSLGSQVVMSPHIGDLDNLASVEVHRRAMADLVEFFRVTPDVVACDLHPDYASTRCAEGLAAKWGVPLVRVQHHHAHVAACMAEHGLEGPVLGLSWDGTGYGTDGTIWGGEALECAGPEFRRIAHLRTFGLAGGDRAVREPRRSALGVLFEILGQQAADYAGQWFEPSETKALLQMLARPRLCPRTSSLGRLFDAVAALCGLPTAISFEGQAAMALEFVADKACDESYSLPLGNEDTAVADWEPAVRAVLADRMAGVPPARISARFHNGLAELAVAIARRWGGRQAILTGGCFQNTLLSRRVHARLADAGFEVYTHGQVPPNDGGIALGQAAIAASISPRPQ
jgi:hydrogenase maturation protein HypF